MPAAGWTDLVSTSTSNTTPTTLDSVAVTLPGPGVLTLQLSGWIYIDADATSSTSLTTSANLGICDTENSSATCHDTYDSYYAQDADNASPNNSTEYVNISRVITIPAAGTYTYYVNGSVTSASYLLYLFQNPKVVAMFFPATLTVTSKAATNPPETPVQQ
jgi:hypothetical protein